MQLKKLQNNVFPRGIASWRNAYVMKLKRSWSNAFFKLKKSDIKVAKECLSKAYCNLKKCGVLQFEEMRNEDRSWNNASFNQKKNLI